MKHDEIVAQHYMSKLSNLSPNRGQRIFWFSKKSKRTILSSLHDLPTKIDFPKTITASIFKNNVIILEKTVQKPNPEKVEEM